MILILTQCFPPVAGGVENLVGGLARAFAAAGERVLVYADAPVSADDASAPYTIVRYDGAKFLRRRRKARDAALLLAGGDVKQVYCDSWKSLEHLKLPPSAAPVVVLAHGSEYPLSPSPRKRWRIQQALDKSRHVLAVSAHTRQRTIPYLRDTQKLGVWHPPFNAPASPSAAVVTRMRALWQDGTPRVLTVARLSPRKGVDAAIRAVADLAATYPALRYVIAGDGAQAAMLRQRVVELNKGGRICFAGAVNDEEKSALYAAADVFLLPGRVLGDDVEGFGLVYMEAAHFGVPSVSGRDGGAAEAVDDGVTGLHCDGGSVESVRQTLSRVLEDESLRRRLGEKARQKAENFSWAAKLRELPKAEE